MSKILLAISEQWVVDQRIDAIGRWAQKLDAPILVVHVESGSGEQPRQGTPGEKTLRDITQRLKEISPQVELLLLFANDVVDGLLKTAEEHQVTMIILGLSRQGVLERLIEGNVQRAILNASRWPVLALPADWSGNL
jgi:nucleotide-binding universal stress UspA family protein